MPGSRFLTLDQLVLPPPWDPLLAVAIVAGMATCAWLVARAALERPRPLDLVATFIAVVAVVAAFAHGIALAGFALLPVSRGLGWILAGFGLVGVCKALPVAWRWARTAVPEAWRTLTWLERAGALVAVVATVALIAAALGPPTDADSLDYHLGAPLDWLRQGRYVPRPSWQSSRLTGIGEALNMLGLATGTDVLGATLAASSLVAAVVAVSSLTSNPRDVVVAALLVVGCPVCLFLVPNQKPQLLPAVALGVAVALLATRWKRLDTASILLASACIGFSVGCKYAALFPAGAAAVLLVLSARASGRTGAAIVFLIVSCALFAGPVFFRNLLAYGDPLTPFFERWKPNPDPVVLGFARALREYGAEAGSGHSVGALLLGMFVPGSPGSYGLALGVGSAAVILADPGARDGGVAVVLASIGVLTAVVLLGQRSGRYLVEPYLWAAMVTLPTAANRARTWLLSVMTGQGLVSMAAAVGLAVMLFPGALSPRGRELVMARSAMGYVEWRWLDSVLPPTCRILGGTRARALAARPFTAVDGIGYSPQPERMLASLVAATGADVAVVGDPPSAEWLPLERACGTTAIESPTFELGVRNPWNRGGQYRLVVIRLDPSRPGCSGWIAAAGRCDPGEPGCIAR